MNLDRALDRIKKCLALSNSANEHEAAAAMRHATALMRKYNLEYSNVLASDASEAAVRSRAKSRPSQWEQLLVAAIAKQFKCAVIIQRAPGRYLEWVFVGSNHTSQVAIYAYEVLVRQVLNARIGFLCEYASGLPAGLKRRLGNRFCLGWVANVYQMISDFADNDEHEPSVRAYIDELKLDPPKSRPRKIKTKIDGTDALAFQLGHQASEHVRLHRGLAKADDQCLLPL